VVLDRVPLFGGTGFACFPYVTSLGLKNYVIQAQQILLGDQCNDARWTALTAAQANIVGGAALPAGQAYVQVVVRSWEDGSTRTRVWTDQTSTLTVQR
jgi:hypothetical protein